MKKLLRNKNELVRYGSLGLVLVLFAIITKGQIFSAYNIQSLSGQMCALMITSIGLIFIFAHGSVDITSGAVSGLCSLFIVLVLNKTGSMAVALIASIAVSISLYVLVWVVSVKFGLMSTIASLAMMFISRGLVVYIISLNDGRINIGDYSLISPFKNLTSIQVAIMALTAAVCIFFFNYTKIGKYSKAIGDNPLAAVQSGADIARVKLLCYVIGGTCVGVSSVFLLARAGNVSRNIGSGIEMNVMVAIILGGMNLNGGARSRVSAAIVGVITYTLLSNGLTIAGVSQGSISMIRGIIFVVIIALTLHQSKSIKEIPR